MDEQPATGLPGGQPVACAWCGRPVDQFAGGRTRRYCRQSCRQRAYEQRRTLRTLQLPDGAVVLTGVEISGLMDRMFQVRAACEDLETAVAEGADTSELADLAADLVRMARRAERLR